MKYVLVMLTSLAGAVSATSERADMMPDPRTPYFTLDSNMSVGGKGEKFLDVSVDARCGETAWLYHRAELTIKRNRFGDVQFVGLPTPGCSRCAPVELRWFHEPTGFLSFEVNIYRRLEVVSCSNEESQRDRR